MTSSQKSRQNGSDIASAASAAAAAAAGVNQGQWPDKHARRRQCRKIIKRIICTQIFSSAGNMQHTYAELFVGGYGPP
jgi:hypothetical protein